LEVDGDFQNGEGCVVGSPLRLQNKRGRYVWSNDELRIERICTIGSIISYERCSVREVLYCGNTGRTMGINKIISQLQFGDEKFGGVVYRGIKEAFPNAEVSNIGISGQDFSRQAKFALVSVEYAYVQDERIVFRTQSDDKECNLKINCRKYKQYTINAVPLPVRARLSEEDVGNAILIKMEASHYGGQCVCEGVLIRTPEPLGRYEMNKVPRGMCVIINNFRFQNEKQNRRGSEHDVKELVELFEQLSFTVVVKENLKFDEMQRVAIDYAKKDHSQYCAFVMVVMSHGDRSDVIFGVEDRYVTVEALMSEYKATNCPTLDGKPKVFIIQTCRGSSDPLPLPNEVCTDSFGISTDSTLPRSTCPKEADFLLAFAQVPGLETYRFEKHGTIFIQVLVDTIRKWREDYHLLDMLTEVTRVVVERTVARGWKPQVPAPSYTLRCQLWLKDVEMIKRAKLNDDSDDDEKPEV